MSIWDNFDTYSASKLYDYLKTIDYTTLTSGETVSNIVNALYDYGDKTYAKEIAEHFVDLGSLPFDRDSVVPISYDFGIVPAVELKFMETISKFPETKFTNYITDRFARFNAGMIVNSGDWGDVPLSTGVLLYDSGDNLLTDFRSGTYISDINPKVWFYNNYEEFSEEMTDFILVNQDSAIGDFEKDGFLKPFYVRNIPENSGYGTADSFGFNGFFDSSNDLSFYHQYECIMNIAKYYYDRYKASGEKDLNSREILRKFLDAIFSYPIFPTELALSNLTMDLTSVKMDSSKITMDQSQVVTLLFGSQDIGYLARIGLACLLAWKVDRIESYLTKATTIYNALFSIQNTNGSIQESVINVSNQALCLEFISAMNNIHYKSYYDICNSALKLMNLGHIGRSNYQTHPENYILDDCKNSVYKLMDEKFYDFEYATVDLTYSVGSDTYNLDNYNVDFHRINSVEFLINGNINYLDLINYQEYLQLKNNNPLIDRPQFYAVNQNNIYVYPTPNADYSIYVTYYKTIEEITNFDEIEYLLSIELYDVIKYSLASDVAKKRDNILASVFGDTYLTLRSNFLYNEGNALDDKKKIPLNIGLNADSVRVPKGFSSWLQS